MRTLPFYKIYPGGNPTILIHDNALFALPDFPEKRRAIATEVMRDGHLGAEQVGFLDTSRSLPHLEMMGGEFCVNGIRSAALIFARLGLLAESASPEGCTREWLGCMTASGALEKIRVRVRVLSSTADYDAAALLPCPGPEDLPEIITENTAGEVMVRLPGITHILIDERDSPPVGDLIAAAAAIRGKYALGNEEAVGVIWHGGSLHTPEERHMTPVVHVTATNSSVLETSCGSGSLALALRGLQTSAINRMTIRQPSGFDITVTFESRGKTTDAWIGGSARLVAEGTAYVGGDQGADGSGG